MALASFMRGSVAPGLVRNQALVELERPLLLERVSVVLGALVGLDDLSLLNLNF